MEPEFARVVNAAKRESNTLSAVIREAWDSGDLSVMTKNSASHATDAHIGMVTHITHEELAKSLSTVDVYNGFGNRFSLDLCPEIEAAPQWR